MYSFDRDFFLIKNLPSEMKKSDVRVTKKSKNEMNRGGVVIAAKIGEFDNSTPPTSRKNQKILPMFFQKFRKQTRRQTGGGGGRARTTGGLALRQR